jgi:hypothetical protein
VLSYLVTSKTRRRLLELLWRREATGSASELARAARVSFAGAYRELKAMESAGLARVRVQDGREVYAAATEHPHADLVRRLVASKPATSAPQDERAAEVRHRARALGAPLATAPSPVPDDQREGAVVDAVRLARRDATLARVMPVLLWRQRSLLDRARLEEAATHGREKHALGFLLALTAAISGDRSLARWAESLRDRRVRTVRPFFDLPSVESPLSRRTPAIARAWGFSMDLDLDAFKSMFDKHIAVDAR